MEKREFLIKNIEDLPAAAEWLDSVIRESGCTVVALDGGMGVGKTTLVGEYSRQRGVEEGISSPTFAIVNEYVDGRGDKIFHFDCYRFESEQEAIEIGVFDYFDSGSLCFVEWPERIEGILGECDFLRIKIELTEGDNRRLSVDL